MYKRGMTLIELLIVLALMAGLAGMALTSVGEMSYRARYDETLSRLAVIGAAIEGDGDGVGRFVRDMGRLPRVRDAGEGRELSELWDAGGLDHFGEIVKDDIAWPDPFAALPQEVRLHSGWNGPYIASSPSGTLYDGFGNGWQVNVSASSELWRTGGAGGGLSGDETIYGVRSLGSDGAVGGLSWDKQDIVRNFFGLPEASLTVVVQGLDAGASPPVWQPLCELSPLLTARNWKPNTGYAANDWCVAQAAGRHYVFRTSGGGLSGGAVPGWNSSSGTLTLDNEVQWRCEGALDRVYGQYVDRLRVALFVPDGEGAITAETAFISDSALTPGVEFSGLVPGVRAVYAYCFSEAAGGGETLRRSGEQPQTIELKPGANRIELYLR